MNLAAMRKRIVRFREWRARRAEVSRCASGGPYCYKCRERIRSSTRKMTLIGGGGGGGKD